MKAILLPSDPSKAIELINVPMIDGYVQVCNTMNWNFSCDVEFCLDYTEYFLVCDEEGIINNSKLNFRASKLCTISYSTYCPIFGDVLLFVKNLNAFGQFEYWNCDEDNLNFIRGILNE